MGDAKGEGARKHPGCATVPIVSSVQGAGWRVQSKTLNCACYGGQLLSTNTSAVHILSYGLCFLLMEMLDSAALPFLCIVTELGLSVLNSEVYEEARRVLRCPQS